MRAKADGDNFKDGDLVVLKSGGPVMTVNEAEVYGGDVACVWFAGKKREQARFSPTSLRHATDDDK